MLSPSFEVSLVPPPPDDVVSVAEGCPLIDPKAVKEVVRKLPDVSVAVVVVERPLAVALAVNPLPIIL